MLIVSFSDKEEHLFQEIVDWLSCKYMDTSNVIIEHSSDLLLNPFTRTVTNKNGKQLYLTAKGFDLLYYIKKPLYFNEI